MWIQHPFKHTCGHPFVFDCRCEPGWSGNRCHVKEKPSLTTSSPTVEATQLGNKEAQLSKPPALNRLIYIYILAVNNSTINDRIERVPLV